MWFSIHYTTDFYNNPEVGIFTILIFWMKKQIQWLMLKCSSYKMELKLWLLIQSPKFQCFQPENTSWKMTINWSVPLDILSLPESSHSSKTPHCR